MLSLATSPTNSRSRGCSWVATVPSALTMASSCAWVITSFATSASSTAFSLPVARSSVAVAVLVSGAVVAIVSAAVGTAAKAMPPRRPAPTTPAVRTATALERRIEAAFMSSLPENCPCVAGVL
jgi:hypothetical protein